MLLKLLKHSMLAVTLLLTAVTGPAASAETTADYKMKTVEAAFSDVVLDIRNAIINGGFVIDMDHLSVTKARRFMEAYGCLPIKAFDSVGILTDREAQAALAKFKAAYPGVKRFCRQ